MIRLMVFRQKPGYTPDMFARLRLVWRRPASAYERKLSTRKPDTDRRWWLCVTNSQTYRAINRKYNDRKWEQVWWHQPPPSLPRRGGTVTLAIDKPLIIRRLLTINITCKGICPSPTGEDRWGLMSFNQNNLFLHLGKVTMFCQRLLQTIISTTT